MANPVAGIPFAIRHLWDRGRNALFPPSKGSVLTAPDQPRSFESLPTLILCPPVTGRTGVVKKVLQGKIALVAGATRGAGRGIAIALGEAGATVYCTGRSSRRNRRRTPGRPETIEET